MFVEVAYKSYLRSAGIQKLGRQIRKLLNKNLEWVLNSGLVEKEQELDKEGFLGIVIRSSDSAKAVIRARGSRELEDIPPSYQDSLLMKCLAIFKEIMLITEEFCLSMEFQSSLTSPKRYWKVPYPNF